MFTHATEREFPLDIKSQFDKTFRLYLCVQFSGFVQVLENLESLGIFSSPGKRLQFLECPKNLLNSSNKVFRIYACNVFRPLGELSLKSWDCKGLR